MVWVSFKSFPQEIRAVVFFQWEEPIVLITAYPGVCGHVRFAQRARSHLVLQARCFPNYRQGMPQTWTEGKQILCTPQQQLRGQLNLPPLPLWERKNVVSNGHKLFLSFSCVTYLHGGQGKCDTIAKDDKKLYWWIHLLYLSGLRFFPCSQMQKSNPCVYA